MNTIIPSNGIQSIGSLFGEQTKKAQPADAVASFGTIFKEAVQEVEQLQEVKMDNQINLALGDMDNLGEFMASSERATTAFQLLVNVRNKLLDSYQEIMRMNV